MVSLSRECRSCSHIISWFCSTFLCLLSFVVQKTFLCFLIGYRYEVTIFLSWAAKVFIISGARWTWYRIHLGLIHGFLLISVIGCWPFRAVLNAWTCSWFEKPARALKRCFCWDCVFGQDRRGFIISTINGVKYNCWLLRFCLSHYLVLNLLEELKWYITTRLLTRCLHCFLGVSYSHSWRYKWWLWKLLCYRLNCIEFIFLINYIADTTLRTIENEHVTSGASTEVIIAAMFLL